MKKRIQEWKEYIKESKTKISENQNNIAIDIYYVNNQKISNYELNVINETVKRIADSDEFIINPIGKIINKEIFNELTEEEKMRYILDLSKIYIEMKSKIKNIDLS